MPAVLRIFAISTSDYWRGGSERRRISRRHPVLLPIRHEVEGGVGAGVQVVLCARRGGLAAYARDFLPTVGDIDPGLEVAGAHHLDRLKLALEAEVGFQFREDGDANYEVTKD